MQSRIYVMLRAIEFGLGAAVVVALVVAINGGWLTSSTEKFSEWYASRVDGVLEVTVVRTGVELPHVKRADLPIRETPQSAPVFSASHGDAATTGVHGAG